ncbi:hypothetical protein [Streptomyces sp. NRRL WC-3549]|uniref:hypothetical protein n=1 Tax=Streptomyces sp. NRRL WC-3549 TaxID=1463925 RepID=UPI0004C54BF1|nr:hypothetical protein [Streptomyces sp. NRRL WC-3549]
MRPVPARPLARLATSAAVVTGALLTGLSVPASADEPQSDQLWISVPYEQNLQAGSESETDFEVGLYHDNDTFSVIDGQVTVDVSGLAGVAEVSWPSDCAPAGTTAVCDIPVVPVIGEDYAPQITLGLRPAAGAELGAQGKVTYEATALGGPDGTLEAPKDSFVSTVTVTSGPDLALNELDPVTGAQPGSVHTLPLTVTNRGAVPAQGFTLGMTASYGLGFDSRYDVCTYTDLGADDYAPMYQADCAFDQVLEPGETFTLPEPLRMSLAPHALTERLDISLRPGGGAEDIAEEDNYVSVALKAVSTADFSVRDVKVSGAAGDTVRADVTFRNNGPGWFGNLGSGDSVALVEFTVPAGTTATSVPEACEPRALSGGYRAGRLGAPSYVCEMPYWVLEDTTRVFPFDLRVDTVVPDAHGAVTLRPASFGTDFPFDPEPGNNTATVTVNPTA